MAKKMTIHRQSLSPDQLTAVFSEGGVTVKLRNGPKQRITATNVFDDGHIEYYKRSGSNKIAVRRYVGE